MQRPHNAPADATAIAQRAQRLEFAPGKSDAQPAQNHGDAPGPWHSTHRIGSSEAAARRTRAAARASTVRDRLGADCAGDGEGMPYLILCGPAAGILPTGAMPPEPIRIDARAVTLQFARRAPLAGAGFLYDEVARRMIERLDYVKIDPQLVLDVGCGAGNAAPLLAARYPRSRYLGVDACPAMVEAARRAHRGLSLRDRLAGLVGAGRVLPRFECAAAGALPAEPGSAGLVWSNLMLHWHPAPHTLFPEWRRVLKVGGLVMFSCFGPGSLSQLRAALAAAGLARAAMPFVDMHDFGDMLVEHGFATPVMDQETITLTSREPARLLDELRELGGNAAAGRFAALSGRGFRRRLEAALEEQRDAQGLIPVSFEVAYGHAWKEAARRNRAGEAVIPVDSIRRAR